MENYPYNLSFPDSGNSSPRSREIDFENPPSWEDQPPPNYRVRFMCSYGGKIHPRPHDNQLSYIGGDTKILSVDRAVRFGSLLAKLIALCDSDAISFKYQLPGEDLDALISVTNDEDLEHMMHEYDRLCRVSPKPERLRIFVFSSPGSSVPSFGSDDGKSEKEKFVDALNSAPQPSAIHVPASNLQSAGIIQELKVKDPVVVPGHDPIQKHILDLQRMRIDEVQQGSYGRKSGENLSGSGEYHKLPDKISGGVSGGVPYWADKQIPGGVFGNQQPVYVMPAPASAYHAPMVRPMSAQPAQGYYRMPSEVYRDPQPMYNMFPQGGLPSAAAGPPPPKVTAYSEGFAMVRPLSAGGAGVGMAYDGSVGRQVVYPAPIPGHAAQFQPISAAVSGDMRSVAEAGGKVIIG